MCTRIMHVALHLQVININDYYRAAIISPLPAPPPPQPPPQDLRMNPRRTRHTGNYSSCSVCLPVSLLSPCTLPATHHIKFYALKIRHH